MLLLVVFAPLFGFLGSFLFGKYIDSEYVFLPTYYSAVLVLWFINDLLTFGIQYKISLGTWIHIQDLEIAWSFLFDSLSLVMCFIVTFISFWVHFYSNEYMKHDPHFSRFMSYLSLFTFFMLILVTANNFLQMFIGWEGVGLASYLLINFWFTRIQANKAAIKAMLVNRVGDFALLIAIFLIFYTFHSLDYDVVFGSVTDKSYFIYNFLANQPESISWTQLDLICLFLFIGAMGKSAQLGLHIWLPDAMEGPTPVSALIHAATMVTAGIFLICRCSYFFEFSPFVLNIVVFVGSATAFTAATIGLFQNDIKKVIAYSTCSQLGYMIFACGLSSYEVGLFHLSNHAFFKALLFLGAGAIIHSVSDEQDMRKMGGLQKLLPFSYAMMLIGSLALMGFPFLTGFYSKDVILELAYARYDFIGHYAYFLGVAAAFCTAFYSIRLLYLVFLSPTNGNRIIILNAHENSFEIITPLVFLCFFSINIGYLSKDFFIGFGTDFWGSSLFVLPTNHVLIDSEFIPTTYKLLPLIVTILGSLFAYMLYVYGLRMFLYFKKNRFFYKFICGLNRKWFFDRIYTEFITQNILKKAYFFSYQVIDRGLLEYSGPSSFVYYFKNLSKASVKAQTGLFWHYFIYFIGGVLLLLILFF